ncbi:glutathione S-transferase N-terminal domain-containing protein [Pseudidiomarina salilacus]|uniref:glutathione S-transferase N-terminal domain-containing protein n=1 Tax=Pseudidiomarina salilacus TaxID=3384452 RepID=UPI0039855B78
MNKLIWIVDSPFSRSIKWLLLQREIDHTEHLLTWDGMKSDRLLAEYNPKLQVPTLITKEEVLSDSLLIILPLFGHDWHRTTDAKLFRLGDCDFEATLIFLFRANLLERQFGSGEASDFMRQTGVTNFQKNVDVLLDHLLTDTANIKVNVGLVLVFSMVLIARFNAQSDAVRDYRYEELLQLNDVLAADPYYQQLAQNYTAHQGHQWPFFLVA